MLSVFMRIDAHRKWRNSMSKLATVEPLAVDVEAAAKIAGVGRTHFYQEIKKGRLRAVKSGSRTLVRMTDLREYLDSLASAKIGASS